MYISLLYNDDMSNAQGEQLNNLDDKCISFSGNGS